MIKKLNRQHTNATQQYPVKVLQFGEGNFLRAFADWMVDLMNEKAGFNGSVQIIQPLENGMAHQLNAQDGLYHVVLNGLKNGQAQQIMRLITAVNGVIDPYKDIESFLNTAKNPDLKFVISNTTEAGIAFDPQDHSPATLPRSFPGKLTLLLHQRFKHFNGDPSKALTILPCELIDKNGHELKKVVLQYAELWNLSKEFTAWIEKHTVFCNTLVDRIVPGFPKDNIAEIQQQIGYEDTMVVMGEFFHLWVIEGPPSLADRLPLLKAGLDVKFVKDLSPYRTRKVRILNGAHTAMVPVAYLHGLRTVREAVENEYIGKFIREAVFEEIIPTLDLPSDELQQFAHDVIERFQNPFIRHELMSIALNSFSKYQVRVLPSILEFIKRKKSLPEKLLFSLAALIRFYKGEWSGEIIPLKDTPEVLDFMKRVWQTEDYKKIAQDVLGNVSFWGQDLTQIDGMVDFVANSLTKIEMLLNVEK